MNTMFLLITLVYILFSLIDAQVPLSKLNNNLTVHAILPFQYKHSYGATNLAIEWANSPSSGLFPNHTVRIQFYPSDGEDGTQTIQSMLKVVSTVDRTPLIIGPNAYGDSAQAISTQNDLVNIAPLGGELALSDKTKYPTYCRLEPTYSTSALPLIDICKKFGWKKVGLLSDTLTYIETATAFVNLATQENIQILANAAFQSGGGRQAITPQTLDITNSLILLRKSNVRIIILLIFQRDVPTIIDQLDKFGMTKPPYQLVGLADWVRHDPNYNLPTFPNLYKQLNGMIASYNPIDTVKFNKFRTSWIQRVKVDPSFLFNFPSPQPQTSFMYDTGMVGLIALHNLTQLQAYCPLNPNYDTIRCSQLNTLSKSKMLFELIKTVQIDGLSGRVSLDSNCDRPPQFSIINFQSDRFNVSSYDKGRIVVGSWTSTQKLIINDINMNSIVWNNGMIGIHGIPPDTDPTIKPGDSLEKTVNSIIIIASYVLCVFACWSCLILLEQVMFEAKKNQSSIYSRLVSGVVLGVGGFWSCNWLGMSAVSLSNSITINYSPLTVFLSMPMILIFILISFDLFLRDMANKVRAAKYTTSTTKTSVTTRSDKFSLKYVFNHFCSNYSINNIYSTLILMLGQGIFHILLVIDLEMSSRIEYNSPSSSSAAVAIAGAIILSFILLSIGLQSLFYLKRFRGLGAFILAAGIIGPNQLIINSHNYIYSPHTESYWIETISSELLLILCSIIGAFCCFIFLGLQFNKMRLSRNSLDLLLEKSKKALADVDLKYAIAKNDVKQHQDTIKEKQTEIDLINWGRIITADDLIAWAFGQRNKATDAMQWKTDNFDISSEQQQQRSKHSGEKRGTQSKENTGQLKGTGTDTEERSVERVTATNNSNNVAEGKAVGVNMINNNYHLSYWQSAMNQLSASNSAATPQILLKSITMQDVLNDPFCLELFKDSVKKDLGSESLEFYITITIYKKLPEIEPNADKLKELRNEFGRSIATQFLGNDSRTPLNISSTLVKALLTTISKEQCNQNTFDEAATEARKLLETNNWGPFQEKREFRICAIKLKKIINQKHGKQVQNTIPSNTTHYSTPKQQQTEHKTNCTSVADSAMILNNSSADTLEGSHIPGQVLQQD